MAVSFFEIALRGTHFTAFPALSLLTLPPLRASTSNASIISECCSYPRDALATCCRHTYCCQGPRHSLITEKPKLESSILMLKCRIYHQKILPPAGLEGQITLDHHDITHDTLPLITTASLLVVFIMLSTS
jgi:hypothetical protein